MNGGVAIFVKTPGLSPVKTRLANGLGRAQSETWYLLAAAAVAAVAGGIPGLSPYWALAEPRHSAARAWAGLPHLEQGEGELGARMSRVHASLLERHDFALLLGADTPQLGAAHLREAASWLAAKPPRLVMGPARDGGFWLLGANCQPPLADWVQTPCGRTDTAAGFLEAFEQHGEWRLLETLTDVDHVSDLPALLEELARLDRPHSEQQRLADWTRAALRVG